MVEFSILRCGKGWEKLYQPIVDKVIEYDKQQKDVKDKIGIAYIKEHDGYLKICLNQPHNANCKLIGEIYNAELKSRSVCEFCGETNDIGVTMNNAYKTTCKKCWETYILPKHDDSIWQNLTTKKHYKKISK